jgi:hypothetical protein
VRGLLTEIRTSLPTLQETLERNLGWNLEERDGLNRGGRYLRHFIDLTELVIMPFDTDQAGFGNYLMYFESAEEQKCGFLLDNLRISLERAQIPFQNWNSEA